MLSSIKLTNNEFSRSPKLGKICLLAKVQLFKLGFSQLLAPYDVAGIVSSTIFGSRL